MFNCLNYSVVERKNPKCPDKEGKFYAQFQSRGVLESKELIEKIDRNCYVGKPDIVAVLMTLEDVVAEAICDGYIVRIGELGSLSMTISSDGCDRKDDFCSKHITKVKTLFKDGKTIKHSIRKLTFKKVEQKYSPVPAI